MRNTNKNNMFMTPTDPNEIGKYIDSLKNKNSSGHDEMTSTFLKSVKSAVVQPSSILINKSLETGIVPDKLKLAKVIPIYKSKVTGRVNCTYCTPGFGPQSLHTITLLLSRALAVARA